MMTSYGVPIEREMLTKRLNGLVNKFYKILPIRESEEPTLNKYLLSLQREMLGSQSLIIALNNDERYLILMSILQYMLDNECSVDVIRSEVFKAIGILKKLEQKYASEVDK